MAEKKTGISFDLLIHPGETISEILEVRGITQAELAAQTGVSAAYVSNILSGKKGISAKFAFSLEYALDVPKSFWMNLQANYDAEIMELNEVQTITEEERAAREALNEIVKYLRKKGKIPERESRDASILSLRKALNFSNLDNLKEIVPFGAFRMAAGASVDPYVLGAWVRMCQLSGKNDIDTCFKPEEIENLICEIKSVMLNQNADIQNDLRKIMAKYGIDFSVVRNFRGAPVQGYISQKANGTYQMVLTIRGAFADIFWFSIFHELGHIMNGDVGKSAKFIDSGLDVMKERAADSFASKKLIADRAYSSFIKKGDYSINAIKEFAASQNVMPYIVIGRLQREKRLDYSVYSEYKLRYKWGE